MLFTERRASDVKRQLNRQGYSASDLEILQVLREVGNDPKMAAGIIYSRRLRKGRLPSHKGSSNKTKTVLDTTTSTPPKRKRDIVNEVLKFIHIDTYVYIVRIWGTEQVLFNLLYLNSYMLTTFQAFQQHQQQLNMPSTSIKGGDGGILIEGGEHKRSRVKLYDTNLLEGKQDVSNIPKVDPPTPIASSDAPPTVVIIFILSFKIPPTINESEYVRHIIYRLLLLSPR